jgi:hypothetical protein
MPSSGVSDGVQSMITGLYPESLFCAIETSGDGKVNVQSRVQMFLFKARQAAQKEYTELLGRLGVTREEVAAFLERHPRFASPLHRAPHAAAGTAADRLAELAPYLGKSPLAMRALELRETGRKLVAGARALPGWLERTRRRVLERSPELLAQAREEWVEARPVLARKLKTTAREAFDQTVARFGAAPPRPTRTPAEAVA